MKFKRKVPIKKVLKQKQIEIKRNWHKNKIKLNFKGWNWKTNPINKGIQNQINSKKNTIL
jgi:CRISPR/Cas system-associated exonuclease Cas4 (RecB family)